VIRTFVDKEAEKIWQGTPSRRLPADIQVVARRKLRMLNSAQQRSTARPRWTTCVSRRPTAWKR